MSRKFDIKWAERKNVQIIEKLNESFAAVVNTYVRNESISEVRKFYVIFDQEVRKVLHKHMVEMANEYDNEFQDKKFKHQGFNGELTPEWMARKEVYAEKFGNGKPYTLGQPNYYKGFGYLGKPDKRGNSLEYFLKRYGQIAEGDVQDLYNEIGAAKLVLTGGLATKKGVIRKGDQFFKEVSEGKYKKISVSQAINHAKIRKVTRNIFTNADPNDLRVPRFLVRVNKKGHIYAFKDGKRVSMLELEAEKLVGTGVSISAFHNYYQNLKKVNGVPTMGRLRAYRASGRMYSREYFNDNFGYAAIKMRFNAMRGRDPFLSHLREMLEIELPLQIKQRYQQKKR